MSDTQTTLREEYASALTEKESPETPVEETKSDRVRDESGRFAKEAAEDATQTKVSQETPVASRPPRPSSWKKDYEADWETLNPRLASYIDQREKEYAKGVSTYKQEWDRAKPLLDVLNPYQEHLQKYGIRPEQFVQNLAAAHQALAMGNPQEKLQHFARLAREYGVDLRAFAPRPDGQPQQDPRVMQWLQSQIAPVKQELAQFKTAQQQRDAEKVKSEIESFKSSKGHEHFESLKDTMANLLEKGVCADLDSAYSTAMRMPQHDDIWTAMQEEKRKSEEVQRAKDAAATAAAAKKKAVSPKSSSPTAQASTGKNSLRDEYAEALGGLGSRV